MLLRDAHVEVALRDFLLEDHQSGAAGHRAGDGDDLLVLLGEISDGARENLAVGRLVSRRSLAGLDVVFAEAVEFARIFERWFVAFALLRDDVEDDRFVLGFQEFEGLDEQREVVTVDRAVVADAELIEKHAAIRRSGALREDQAFGVILGLAGEFARILTEHELDELRRLLMQ